MPGKDRAGLGLLGHAWAPGLALGHHEKTRGGDRMSHSDRACLALPRD